jgi:hypothetical protein
LGFWGILGIEIWGDRHSSGDPFIAASAARKFVEELIKKETWCTDYLLANYGLRN